MLSLIVRRIALKLGGLDAPTPAAFASLGLEVPLSVQSLEGELDEVIVQVGQSLACLRQLLDGVGVGCEVGDESAGEGVEGLATGAEGDDAPVTGRTQAGEEAGTYG